MDIEKKEGGRLVHRRMRLLVIALAALLCLFCVLLYNIQVVHGAEYRERAQYKNVQTETVNSARGEILDSLGRVLVSNRLSYQVTLDTSELGSAEERNATLRQLVEICQDQGVDWNDTLPVTDKAPFAYTVKDPFYTVSADEDGKPVYTLTRLGQLALKLKLVDSALLQPPKEAPSEEPKEEAASSGGILSTIKGWFGLGGKKEPAEPAEEAEKTLPTAQELLDALCLSFGLIEADEHAGADDRAAAGVLYELSLRSHGINWSSYIFAQNVDISFISIVKERSLPGVEFETTTVRQYNTTYAAHVLGRVGQIYAEEWADYQAQGYPMDAIVGKNGVERAFEEYLRGTAGTLYQETNTSGKVISESWMIDPETGEELSPRPGGNVALTIDIRLQETVERALAEHIPTLPEAQGGAAVIIKVDDGSVLAMASYPTYDLATNTGIGADMDDNILAPLLNRVTMGLYPPGSTFKMVTATGALEEGIITPTDKIRDTGKYMYYAPSYTPSCWIYRQNGGTHGLLNVSQAITESCNVFFYDVGRRLGIEKMNEYARMYGLGEPTGIELGEYTGVVAGPDYTEGVLHQVWYEGSTLSAAIGQENNQFTPLQLANYIATLVNGGNHYSAHLLKEVKSADFSEVLYTREPELLDTIEIDPVNLEAIKKGMLAVTQSGSAAKYFRDLDIKVGAKTGSAQVSVESESNAVFVAFAPYDDPEIALCIVVEKGGSGSELGAIAADIISYYFSSEATLGAGQGENTLIR